MEQPRLGYLGLGQMGAPMTRNLLRAGYTVTVYDVEDARAAALAEAGATRATAPAEVMAGSDVVLACLPNGDIVRDVVLGDGGLVEAARAGQVLIDMTTNYPADSAALAEILSGHGVDMLDAPVSGGETGAVEGTLSIMVGGSVAVYERCLPVLRSVGRHIERMGDAVGSGGHAKLANQIMVCIHLASVAEAMVYAERTGLELARLIPALQAGHANSTILGVKAPKIMARDFSPVGPTWMSYKDLTYIHRAMVELGLQLPVVDQVLALYRRLMDEGHGDLDQMVLLELYERMADPPVR